VKNKSLSGDQARAAAKQAAESLKNQVREKLGGLTGSAVANAIINGRADTGNAKDIDQVSRNGAWTSSENAPAESVSMPKH